MYRLPAFRQRKLSIWVISFVVPNAIGRNVRFRQGSHGLDKSLPPLGNGVKYLLGTCVLKRMSELTLGELSRVTWREQALEGLTKFLVDLDADTLPLRVMSIQAPPFRLCKSFNPFLSSEPLLILPFDACTPVPG